MTDQPPLLEICVQGVESALAAAAGGAHRIELCERLEAGGVTPSAGAIRTVCQRLSIPVRVLIRPREGDFHPTDAEFEAMRADIQFARDLGASGVVLGLLNPDLTIDEPRTAALIAAAGPLPVTFHKAFDLTPDPFAALEACHRLGVDRILTSGQAPTALQGRDTLAALVRTANNRLTLLAGGQLRPPDIPPLHAAGLREFHLGSAATLNGQTSAAAVRELRDLIEILPRP